VGYCEHYSDLTARVHSCTVTGRPFIGGAELIHASVTRAARGRRS